MEQLLRVMSVAGHSIGNKHIVLRSHTHQTGCVSPCEKRVGQHLAHQRPASWILGQHLGNEIASQRVLDQVYPIILKLVREQMQLLQIAIVQIVLAVLQYQYQHNSKSKVEIIKKGKQRLSQFNNYESNKQAMITVRNILDPVNSSKRVQPRAHTSCE